VFFSSLRIRNELKKQNKFKKLSQMIEFKSFNKFGKSCIYDLNPPDNLEAIKNALIKGGNQKVTTKELPNLNHLFQDCNTGSPVEYSKIEQTISPNALGEISNWLQLQL
jgi:hypothetical protein